MQSTTVRRYMSHVPYTVGPQQPVEVARDLMMLHAIRHLPVVDNGKLVGIISQRDLDIAEQFYRGNAAAIRIDYAMTGNVFTVTPDTPLEVAADYMARTHHGSVVVVEGENVVGIFTMVDACRALRDNLQSAPSRATA